MHPNIPDEVRWLVSEYLPTIEHIDILLFLVRNDQQAKPLTEITADLATNAEVAERRMRDLVQAELVSETKDDGGAPRYSYAAQGLKQRLAVAKLLETYTVRPVSLIRFVYERPPRKEVLQQFSDAFRFRDKDKP